MQFSIFIIQGGYRLSLWEFRNDHLSLAFINDVENSASCNKLLFFDCSTYAQFATIENTCIKYWKFESTHKLMLLNRIHLAEPVLSGQSCLNQFTNFLFFLSSHNKLCVINQDGEFVSSVQNDQNNDAFTAVTCNQEYLFLGTSKGSVKMYDTTSLQFVKDIPYPRRIKDSISLFSNYNAKAKEFT